jgi:hypothetical protein
MTIITEESDTIRMQAEVGYEAGDTLRFSRPDYRWWMRFWYWATFRSNPEIHTYHTVTTVENGTITINKE